MIIRIDYQTDATSGRQASMRYANNRWAIDRVDEPGCRHPRELVTVYSTDRREAMQICRRWVHAGEL